MKKKLYIGMLSSIILTGFVLAGCAGEARSVDEDAQGDIAEVNEQFMQAWEQGDAAAIAALYTNDARLFPPDMEGIQGREGIEQYFNGGMEAGIKHLELETLELEVFGDTAYEIGVATTKKEDGEVIKRGNYMVVWKKNNGTWQLHRDILN